MTNKKKFNLDAIDFTDKGFTKQEVYHLATVILNHNPDINKDEVLEKAYNGMILITQTNKEYFEKKNKK